MTQSASHSIAVAASPQVCLEVITEVERYPQWICEIKEVKILARGDEGLPSRVFFRVGAMGRSVSYTLDYYYGSNPLRVAWRLMEGTLLRRLDGEYRFIPVPSDPSATDLHFRLEVDMLTKMPGFVTRRAEQRIINSAIDGVRNRAEQIAMLEAQI